LTQSSPLVGVSNRILTGEHVASIQSKRSKSGKKTFYVVVSLGTKHKWIKAGSLQDAKILKKTIEGMAESERLDKLGISPREKRIDDVFQEYRDSERGLALSGGEKQRVCLVRAILKEPPIFILDEATSALNSKSEYLIQDSLTNILSDKTAIIIAH